MALISSSTPSDFYYVYCDESRQQANRYMVLGGVILERKSESHILDEIDKFRRQHRMFSELKWSKVSKGKLEEYKAFVDLYNRLSPTHLRFKALTVETSRVDHTRYNRSDGEVGFYKFFYQFLLHSFGRELRTNDQCIVTLDRRSSSQKLSTLQAILNNGIRKKYQFTHTPIREIRAMDSKKCEFIQIADVLMGAIGYELNGDDKTEKSSPPKVALKNYIKGTLGVWSFAWSVPRDNRKISLWHFDFSKTKKKG